MFTVSGKGIEVACKAVAGVTKSVNYPVLSSAVVTMESAGLTVAGTNHDVWTKFKIDSDRPGPDNPITIQVDAAGLSGIVKGLKGATMVDVANGRLTVGAAGIDDNMIPVEDYPTMPELRIDAGVLSLSGAEFKQMVKQWRQVAKKTGSTSRASLTCVNIVATDSGTEFALTNGYTLLYQSVGDSIPAGTGDHAGLFPVDDIKQSTSGVAAKSIVSLSLATEVATNDRYLVIDVAAGWGSASYSIRGIGETFPDYRRVIPNDNKIRFTVDPSELGPVAAAGYRAAPEETHHVTITLDRPGQPDRDRLVISADRPGVSYENSIAARGCISQCEFEPTCVNARFLEQLASFTDDTITLQWSARLQAIRADYRSSWADCTYVMMPTNPKA